jgi:hypothetical protein
MRKVVEDVVARILWESAAIVVAPAAAVSTAVAISAFDVASENSAMSPSDYQRGGAH